MHSCRKVEEKAVIEFVTVNDRATSCGYEGVSWHQRRYANGMYSAGSRLADDAEPPVVTSPTSEDGRADLEKL
ncbi:hypothetical protein EVAR_84328_1 [Eumeta japonica]|uniref:Uncharacterized protein n=1 Tax=Eumeta variegata TaxID=151549 RepID=A0A4C1U487_EUMVA|nr:hypothetical protein EVAR_84328_1 [Eumeta japonica]